MEPTSCGIGGDLFAIVWDAETAQAARPERERPRRRSSLDARAASARGARTIPARGPLPVSVPGGVDGWFELHARFGRLPLRRAARAGDRVRREGLPGHRVIARRLERRRASAIAIAGLRRRFMPGGRAPAAGEPFVEPALARALTSSSPKEGRDAFYDGAIAAPSPTSADARRLLALEDLARAPLRVGRAGLDDYRG